MEASYHPASGYLRAQHACHDFYLRLFGWNIRNPAPPLESRSTPSYQSAMCTDSKRALLRHLRDSAEQFLSAIDTRHWIPRIRIENSKDTLAAIRDAGGRASLVLESAQRGHEIMVADLEGVDVVLWEPRGAWSPSGVGTPHWIELVTRNFETAERFYGQVCRWRRKGMSWVRADGVEVASVRLLPATQPRWLLYFGCANLQETVGRALRLGARPIGIPGLSHRRSDVLIDPAGAEFGLIELS